MTNELLISFNDFAQYKSISKHINKATEIDPYILESQRLDLSPFLGAALYYDIISTYPYPSVSVADPLKVNYTPLIEGEVYERNGKTVQFYGLKPVIVYYSYKRFIANLAANVTSSGVVVNNTNYSSPVGSGQLKVMMNEAESNALKYQNDAYEYLCEKKSEYPLFEPSVTMNKSSVKILQSKGRTKHLRSGDNERFEFYSR